MSRNRNSRRTGVAARCTAMCGWANSAGGNRMALYEAGDQFAGHPVVVWEPGTPLADPAGTNSKILLDWEECEEGQKWTHNFAAFLADPASRQVAGLVVGIWSNEVTNDGSEELEEVIEALVAAR